MPAPFHTPAHTAPFHTPAHTAPFHTPTPFTPFHTPSQEEAARLATRKVHIQYVYRIPSTLRPLVTPTHPKDTLLTPDEVVHVVREYAQRHQLLQGENQVKLDAFLASSLFKKGEGVMLGMCCVYGGGV